MDISVSIDVDSAVEALGGEMDMFCSIMSKFETMTLESSLTQMITHYDNKDYLKVKEIAHSLKGAVGYVGASRLYYQCYFMQFHYLNGDYDSQMAYYPGLIEASIEYKVASRVLLA